MILAWFLFACSSEIKDEYEKNKAQVLQKPAELGDNWQPDIILRLNYSALSDVAIKILSSELQTISLEKEFLGAKFLATSNLTLQSLQIEDVPADHSMKILGRLTGPWAWKWKKLQGSESSDISFEGIAKISLEDGEMQLKIRKITKLEVHINPIKSIEIGSVLSGIINKKLSDTPPISLGKMDLEHFSMRKMRLMTTPTSSNIEIRSNVNHHASIQPPNTSMKQDWQLMVHQDTLLGWAQKAAFEKGIVALDTAVDIRDLSIEDTNFTLNLRLWNIGGVTHWWRDYQSKGSLSIRKNHLHFSNEELTEGLKSPLADWVDPLALMGEGLILEEISAQLQYSLPIQQKDTLKNHPWKFQTNRLKGEKDTLYVYGDIDFSAQKSK